jgi:hypothetical protein
MGTNFSQVNVPQNLDMQSLKAAADSAGQYAKGCRFAAVIKPTGSSIIGLIPRDLVYMCEAVEFPGRGFDITEIRYWGPKQVFPNNVMYGSGINMQFICRQDSTERAFFDNWQDIINPVNNFMFEYPDNYYADINIFQLSEVGGPAKATQKLGTHVGTYGWSLRKCWPTLVNPQQVTWADQDILRLQVSFAYKYWDRPDYAR